MYNRVASKSHSAQHGTAVRTARRSSLHVPRAPLRRRSATRPIREAAGTRPPGPLSAAGGGPSQAHGGGRRAAVRRAGSVRSAVFSNLLTPLRHLRRRHARRHSSRCHSRSRSTPELERTTLCSRDHFKLGSAAGPVLDGPVSTRLSRFYCLAVEERLSGRSPAGRQPGSQWPLAGGPAARVSVAARRRAGRPGPASPTESSQSASA